MEEYIVNGLRLGWLVNPQGKTVEIYQPDQSAETVPFTTVLSGESVLPNFTLDLKSVF